MADGDVLNYLICVEWFLEYSQIYADRCFYTWYKDKGSSFRLNLRAYKTSVEASWAEY